MAVDNLIHSLKFGFMGSGNMTAAVIGAWIDSDTVRAEQIFASNRTAGKLQKLVEKYKIQACKSNEELVDTCDVVILAMKPQDLNAAIEPIASSFDEDQIVISFAAGIGLKDIQKTLAQTKKIVRAIPNTPVQIRKGLVGYSVLNDLGHTSEVVEHLFAPLGVVMKVDEGEMLEALTVGCSSGIGFVFELMIYWQEWLEEYGFAPEQAQDMVVQTFLGAAELARHNQAIELTELQRKVVSKKGVTAAGLASMSELEVERGLRYSFEKAILRDRELGQTSG